MNGLEKQILDLLFNMVERLQRIEECLQRINQQLTVKRVRNDIIKEIGDFETGSRPTYRFDRKIIVRDTGDKGNRS